MDKKGLGGTVILVFIVLFLGGFGVLPTLEHHTDVQEHEPTEATVVSTDIVVDSSGDDTTYEPVVKYRYTVDGETYTNTNVFPGSFTRSFGSRSKAQSVIENYNSGDEVTVYYSPHNNEAAYLTNNGMPGTWWIGGTALVIAFAGGVWLVRTGFRRRKQRQLMEDTPTEKAQSVSIGPSELKGTAVTGDRTSIPAPFSKDDCVVAKYEIKEYHDDNDDSGGSWRTVKEGVEHTPFYVEDDTGSVLVRPHNDATYDLEPEDWTETYVDSGAAGPAPIQDFVQAVEGIDFPHDGAGKEGDRKYRQNLIQTGEDIYVFGTVQPKEDADAGATDEDRLVVRKVGEDDPMAEPMYLISDDEETDLVSRREWALWRLPVGGLFLVGGVAMVVGMFGPFIGITLPLLV